MKKKILSLVLAFTMVATSALSNVTVAAAAETTPEFGEITAVQKGDTVTIGNDAIERTFSVEGDKLSTVEIVNKRTDGSDTVFTPGDGSEEFIVKVTKQTSAAIELEAMDRTGWTATADSRQYASGASDGPASNLLDGDLNSIWHSNYGGGIGQTNFPYNVIITLNGEKTFNCFSYTPRQNGEDTNGNLKEYELWASNADETLAVGDEGWTLISKGEFKYNGVNPIYVNLDEECTATQLKLVAVSAKNGKQFAGGAEFNLHEEKAPVVSDDERSFAASDLEVKDVAIEDTEATINEVEKTGKKVTFTFEPFEFTYKGNTVTYTITENIVMYEGDHFMRKYMEISVPKDQKESAVIDYIDLEHMVVSDDDAQWTVPTNSGGIVEMDQYKANLGQPIYIQGMFFGSEFPETDTEIVDGTGFIRYYTGKSFDRFEKDNQLTTDGKYMTWQTVAGAARSTEQQVIQADFFEYIESIATPTDFRIQYNSWFDNMMLISDEIIYDSFIEMDKELNAAGTRPLDSYVVDDGWINYNNTYVVDANRAGTTLNQSGFWEFNSKFPNGLTTSSNLVHKFGSNFGVWVGPRGGYNFYSSLADILTKSGKGSKAGGSIDVADRNYLKNLTEMFTNWQKEYGVNYWKWDGFADRAQYAAFAAADGVPGYANNHMTGGYNNMYHVTDLWEGWIQVFEAVRESEKEDGVNNLWLSLTCYTNPSPWFLQWANSVWLQCTHDQNDSGSSSSKMDRQMTYRDAAYYEFINVHEFQFPLEHLYNHDPVYGVEGTGMNINTATDEQFQNYLYMMSTRGTAFWELYFSDKIMTEGKYEVTAEFLAWAEKNHHILKNAKMFGNHPSNGITMSNGNGTGVQDAYGYSCFDGTDGIISVRNAATTAKTVTMTFDRTIGVPESAGTLQYHIEHSHNLTEGTETTGTFEYGKTYTFTLQPDEVRMFRVSENGDTTAPEMTVAYAESAKEIIVKFSEKVTGSEFTLSSGTIKEVAQSADDTTYHITLSKAPAAGEVTVTAGDIKDMAGNAMENTAITFDYNSGNKVSEAKGLNSSYGFTVTAAAVTAEEGVLVNQGSQYVLGINEEGKAYFTLGDATAVSDVTVADGNKIVGVKENNGILKLYVNGELAGSAYDEANKDRKVTAEAITVSENAEEAAVYDIAYGYDKVASIGAEPADENLALNKSVTAAWTADGSDAECNAKDRPVSMGVDGTINTSNYAEFGADGRDESSYLQVDIGEVKEITSLNLYRYWADGRTYKGTVIAVSENEDFSDPVVLYNSDADNVHGFGAGEDATYAETEAGKEIVVSDLVDDGYVLGRYVRVYVHGSTAGTTNHIVELQVFGHDKIDRPTDPADDSRDISTEYMTAISDSEYLPGTSNEGPDDFILDNVAETHWHTNWATSEAQNVEKRWVGISLSEMAEVDGLRYLPRQGSSNNGDITEYKIQYRTTDNGEWIDIEGATGTWDKDDDDWKLVKFDAVTAKQVRIVGVHTYADSGNDAHMSAAEIRLTGKISEGTVNPPETVDKEYLAYLIEYAESLNATDYVDFTEVETALAAAKAVYENENATAEDVDAAGDRLMTAIENLVEYSAVPEAKAELTTVIEYAESLNADDYVDFTDVEKAIAAAKAVCADANATLTDVLDAYDALVDAVEALEEKAETPVEEDEVVRLSGSDRYATGIAAADELKEVLGVEKFDTVVIATGKGYADALSGSYLAAVKNAPILLTSGKAANIAELHAYIKANVKAGATIYVLGGEAAVSKEAATIEGYKVTRLAGGNRYETNLAILAEAGVEGQEDLLVATGKDFADSLSASAVSRPILLVKPNTALTDAQKAVAANFANIYVIGGEGAVSASVANELKAYGTVTRLSGASRYETSVAVAEAFFTDPETVVLAYGKNYPDGLCGGALAAALNAPLILTKEGSEDAAAAYVAANGIASGYVLGGDGVLPNDTVVTVFGLESADDIINR